MNRCRPTLAFVVALALSACASLDKPYPDKQTFGITAGAVPPAPRGHTGVLRVERVRIAAPADDRTFLYRTGDNAYHPDYYAEFVAPPERLLTAEVVRTLGAARVYETVLDPDASPDAQFRLETTVTDFYADCRDPAAPKAVLRARVLLIEETRAATRVAATWILDADAPARDATPGAIADAHAGALTALLTKLVARLAE
jgi:uncharacterized lipoprotein YmbA